MYLHIGLWEKNLTIPNTFNIFLQQSMRVCHLTELRRFIFKQC